MSAKNVEDIYALSPMQQGMLFHSLYAPASGVYVEQVSVTLEGELNISAFEKAWQQVVDRHPVLRTAFVWEKVENPIQVVGRQVQLPLSIEDWQHIDVQKQQEEIEAFLLRDRQQGFELSKAPLMRLVLIQLAQNRYHFLWSHHHILLDGWSTSLILQEFFAFYEALLEKAEGRGLQGEAAARSLNEFKENGGGEATSPHSPSRWQMAEGKRRQMADGRGQKGREGRWQEAEGLVKPRPYRDYIAWLASQSLSDAEAFWRETLKGFIAPTPLTIASKTQNSLLPSQYDKQKITLSTATTQTLQTLARQQQLTFNTIAQGTWALLLSRYSSETDVVFGTTVSGRPTTLAGAEEMIGLFINTLPVRIQVEPERSLLDWLKQFQQQQAEARQYEYTPLVQIQQWSELPPGLSLFESIVVFENFPAASETGNLSISEVKVVEQTNYPLTVIIRPDAELELEILYDRDLFAPDAIARMLKHLQTLLEGIIANPESRLLDLPLLTSAEQHQLLVEWNNTQVAYPENICLHQLFEAQVKKTPDAIAVIFEDEQLTYQHLDRQANKIAHYLQELGVKEDTLVGVFLERSLSMLAGLLGILKAGGAYVPLDPSYPAERLAFMLEDTKVAVLLTQSTLIAQLPQHNAKLICLDTNWETQFLPLTASPLPPIPASPENLAYVIYTSGSTGKPKGAMNTHRGICNRLLWMQDTYQLTESDRVLQKTPLSFDVSVWECFWALMNGSCVVVAKPEGHRDSAYLVKLIQQQQITTVHFVPSMLQVFLQEPDVESCHSLKRVICSGEALSYELKERFFERLDGVELHNLYGPTEAAIDVTAWQCQPHEKIVPIGRAIANTQIYILDRNLQPVPIGVPGELHIGGVGLARGYLNRPELTDEKFIKKARGTRHEALGEERAEGEEKGEEKELSYCSQRLYKTGDLARWLPDGSIEFLGRIDDQVKIRGFRIELGEIEAVLRQHPDIQKAVVVLREDEPDDKKLVAYLVPHLKEESFVPSLDLVPLGTPEQVRVPSWGRRPRASCLVPNSPLPLRKFLQKQLPDYMVPSVFVSLDALPLTANGKLDRRALPSPEPQGLDRRDRDVAPRTPIEETVAQIWTEVLRLPKVGIHDNFFELGGHSLLATQLASKIRKTFQVELPLSSIFEMPTIAQLAQEIEKLKKDRPQELTSIPTPISRSDRRTSLASLKSSN